ncbi:MAG: hypothetical protein R2752_03160 [Vicinamibacterales bacterium]
MRIADRRVALTGGWPRESDYWDALVDAAPGRVVWLSWLGNEHIAEFLFAPDPPFDFIPRSRPYGPIAPDARLVPESLVRAHFQRYVADLAPLLARLRAVARLVVVVGPPPPKGDDDALRRRLRNEAHFRTRLAAIGIDAAGARLTPPHVRARLWRVIQDLRDEAAAEAGVRSVECPPLARDHDFLKRQFWGDDVTHANEAFGALMTAHLERTA